MKKISVIIFLLSACFFAGLTQNTQPSIADELIKLKGLLDKGVITKQEFNDLKEKLITQTTYSSRKDSTAQSKNVNQQKAGTESEKNIKTGFIDPEFSQRPYVLMGENALKNLERADAKYDVKVKAFGYGGTEMYFTVFTPKSDSRFSKSALPVFIIKVEGDTDPTEVLKLIKAEEGGKASRKFLISKNKMMGGATSVQDRYISLEYKKMRQGVYEIILPEKILPGEYAFVPVNLKESTSVKINCFAVD